MERSDCQNTWDVAGAGARETEHVNDLHYLEDTSFSSASMRKHLETSCEAAEG